MATWLLAVDAGGSFTRATVWRHGSDEFHEGSAGPGNPWSVGAGAALEAIEQSIAHALGQAGLHPFELGAAVLGIAGNGRLGLPPGFREGAAAWGLPSHTLLTSDLEIATVAGLGDRPGVHAIAGTGSALMLQFPDGRREARAGWGWFLGDPGSAFDLGHRTLQWLVRVWDGFLPPDAFSAHLEETLELEALPALWQKVSEPAAARPWIAAISKRVLDSAAEGSESALQLVEASAQAFFNLILPAVRETGDFPSPVVSFSGGMLRSSVFRNRFTNSLNQAGYGSENVKIIGSSISGAFRLAEEIVKLPYFAHHIFESPISDA